MTILSATGLHLGYHGLAVVHDVSFDLRRGEVVALLGPNGAGKTTIMKAISGLIRPSHGRILLDGIDLAGLPAHRIVSLGLRHVPEGRRVFGSMSVAENLRLGGYTMRRHPADIRDRIDEVYQLFPILGQRAQQLAGTLSGGEQQMLAVGRALITRPLVLALDEPSLGLSPRMSQEILSTARRLARNGTAVLLVEQNIREALRIADRAHVLELGRIVLSGTGADLARDPRVEATYLGGQSAGDVSPGPDTTPEEPR
ncbi:ABC transporter ATP-binding protein [Micromonospora sp. HNM0581]|uniref:ABC transporter ATP-binding protein n=1 Tax=Micromonospora sp. HNM0581 TaxID=2716341 RepID=UPI00146F7637|nr:ABC transporter ATP-binding protein [Micromonospora sp. HNM0581]NLU78500.1 ABC transporter ATP-binding protein [Micromonospora sp. HNM0581]